MGGARQERPLSHQARGAGGPRSRLLYERTSFEQPDVATLPPRAEKQQFSICFYFQEKYDIINLVSLVKGEPPISKQEFYEIEKSPPKLKKYLKDVFNIYEKTIETHFPNKTVYEVFLPMTKSYYELYEKTNAREITCFGMRAMAFSLISM